VKALSVRQPWAHLICSGWKTLEVRSWNTDYRGELLICASASPRDVWARHPKTRERVPLYAGCMVGVVELLDVRPMKKSDVKDSLVAFDPTAYVWVLEYPQFARPDPIVGRLGLWDVSEVIVQLLDDEEEFFEYQVPQGEVKWKEGALCIDDEEQRKRA
jgi:hypothetical protein